MIEQPKFATGGHIPSGRFLSGAIKPGCVIPLPADPDDRAAVLRLIAEEFNSVWHPISLGEEERP